MERPLPKSADEMAGDQALQVLRWLEKNVDYLEHGGKEIKSGFWPHGMCLGCAQARTRVDEDESGIGLPFEVFDYCKAGCDRFQNKSLPEYVLMRIEAENHA